MDLLTRAHFVCGALWGTQAPVLNVHEGQGGWTSPTGQVLGAGVVPVLAGRVGRTRARVM